MVRPCPLHLQIQSEISTAISRYDSRTATSRTFKWNSNYIEEARNAFQTSLNALYIAVETPEVECQETIDSAVDLFTTELSDVMAPLFELKNRNTSDRSRYVYSSRTPIDKPWVTPELKRMYCVYRNDLREFNSSKTRFMHQKLLQIKKAYKVLSAKLKRQYKRIDGNMLDYLRKYNPRAFYSRFHKRHKKRPNADPSIFFEHFKELVAHAPTPSADQSTTFEQTAFDELDCEICEKEILDSIHALKRDKAHGTDLLLNEYFIEFQNYILPIIHNLFNRIFTTGIFPRTWSESIIVPVPKKGDMSDPNNYRGINLVSCFCKLFTSILNHRLVHWSEKDDIITDAQFGVQPQTGTAEAIFCLSSLINLTLSNKKRLYCCFIDFKKAFDSIDRIKLWKKLSMYGIRGKLLRIIRVMYQSMKFRVKSAGFMSYLFRSNIGLLQGEVLSPIFFSLYVNDFEVEFLKHDTVPLQLRELNLYVLMYADDMVFFLKMHMSFKKC